MPLAEKIAVWSLRCIRQTVISVCVCVFTCAYACMCIHVSNMSGTTVHISLYNLLFFFFYSTTFQWFSQPAHRDPSQPHNRDRASRGVETQSCVAMPLAMGSLGICRISRLMELLRLAVHNSVAQAERFSGEDPRRGISGSLSLRLSI